MLNTRLAAWAINHTVACVRSLGYTYLFILWNKFLDTRNQRNSITVYIAAKALYIFVALSKTFASTCLNLRIHNRYDMAGVLYDYVFM